MQVLKIIAILLVSIAVIVAIAIGGLGYGVVKAGQGIIEEVNKPIVQKVENNNGEVTVIVPLKEKKGLKYEGVSLCTPLEHKDEMFFKSIIVSDSLLSPRYICTNGICIVSIEAKYPESLPSNIAMYVTDGGICKKVNFPTNGHLATLGYETTIEFTDELLLALNMVDSNFKVKSQISENISSWQMMGTKKVNIDYNTKVSTDNLKIDDLIKAKIIFKKG
jgi:hypothetical protein